jgi:hypothetical protein
MSKFVAFTSLQKQLGQESAEAVAEFVEAQHQEFAQILPTRDDLNSLKGDLIREITRLREDVTKLREDQVRSESKLREEIARSESTVIKEISGKYSWLVAVLSALGVIITLINKFL